MGCAHANGILQHLGDVKTWMDEGMKMIRGDTWFVWLWLFDVDCFFGGEDSVYYTLIFAEVLVSLAGSSSNEPNL